MPIETTFSDFKQQFYSKNQNLEVFDCLEFNILKVILDGFRVDYVSKGLMPAYILGKGFFINHELRRFKHKTGKKKEKVKEECFNKETLILDKGRIKRDVDESPVSSYFHDVKKQFDQNKICFATEMIDEINGINYDFNFSEVRSQYQFEKLTKTDIELIKALQETYSRIVKQGVFSDKELLNIKYAMHRFFYDYKAWNELLSKSKFLSIYFICHYHKEGFILAAKRNGIKLIELQHGIIAQSDIFYDFPNSFSEIQDRALLADKILTYGEHWSKVLIKGNSYRTEQVDELGFTMFELKNDIHEDNCELQKLIKDKKVILITSQTDLSTYFVEYALFLEKSILEDKLNYIVLIKPHPAEDKRPYKSFETSSIVHLVEINLEALFSYSDYHVSIYSTTLFDRIRYKFENNFSLYVEECNDYSQEIINLGIADKILMDELPYKLESKNVKRLTMTKEYFYSKPNYKVLS